MQEKRVLRRILQSIASYIIILCDDGYNAGYWDFVSKNTV